MGHEIGTLFYFVILVIDTELAPAHHDHANIPGRQVLEYTRVRCRESIDAEAPGVFSADSNLVDEGVILLQPAW